MNLSNNDTTNEVDVDASLPWPIGMLAPDNLQGWRLTNNAYTASLRLKPGQNASLNLTWPTGMSGTFTLPLDLTIQMGNTAVKKHYEDVITITSDKIIPTIKISSGRVAFKSGESVTITGILQNVNTVTTFQSIRGSLASTLFTPVKFQHEAFPPSRTLTEAEATIVMPHVNQSTIFNVTLSGNYGTAGGEYFDFSTQKIITVDPFIEYLHIQHTINPAMPLPGTNITVTVTAKNLFGAYLSYDASDTSMPILQRIGGLNYAQGSLERDEQKTLYIYQLALPSSLNGTFTITTTILVKGETIPMTTTTPFNITPVVQPVVATQNTTPTNTTPSTPAGIANQKKQLGFFATIWDFFKNLL